MLIICEQVCPSKTFLLADKPRRTAKYLLALAGGVPCIQPTWAKDCLKQVHTLLPCRLDYWTVGICILNCVVFSNRTDYWVTLNTFCRLVNVVRPIKWYNGERKQLSLIHLCNLYNFTVCRSPREPKTIFSRLRIFLKGNDAFKVRKCVY